VRLLLLDFHPYNAAGAMVVTAAVTKIFAMGYNDLRRKIIEATDHALLLELRRGNTAALHSLYLKYQSRILSYLARLCGSRETAQDLTSETWCRAVAKLHTLPPDSQLLPWLFTIARNLFFSYCRWRSRDGHYLNELGLLQAGVGPPPTPWENAVRSEQEAMLEKALGQLPCHYREAVILVGIEGLSHEQAAQVTGIRADAARQRFSRGIRLLRESVAPSETPSNKGEAQ
jgi:RNA polymerase sigma-70 factor (ECF subfamily)